MSIITNSSQVLYFLKALDTYGYDVSEKWRYSENETYFWKVNGIDT